MNMDVLPGCLFFLSLIYWYFENVCHTNGTKATIFKWKGVSSEMMQKTSYIMLAKS